MYYNTNSGGQGGGHWNQNDQGQRWGTGQANIPHRGGYGNSGHGRGSRIDNNLRSDQFPNVGQYCEPLDQQAYETHGVRRGQQQVHVNHWESQRGGGFPSPRSSRQHERRRDNDMGNLCNRSRQEGDNSQRAPSGSTTQGAGRGQQQGYGNRGGFQRRGGFSPPQGPRQHERPQGPRQHERRGDNGYWRDGHSSQREPSGSSWSSGQRSGRDDDPTYFLSKQLSFLLRHGAEKAGYKLMEGGFLYVDEILKRQQNLRNFRVEDVEGVVKSNDKQRFTLEREDGSGRLKIRANQGHTLEVKNLDLTPIRRKEDCPVVVHGTYFSAWNCIKMEGLCRMDRNHIHFAPGEPGESGVISGMRKSCEVMIYIDIEKALQDGYEFFRSSNNVILTAGDKDGILPPLYFERAVQRSPFQELPFGRETTSKRPIGLNYPDDNNQQKKKRKNKNKKKGKKGKAEDGLDNTEGKRELSDGGDDREKEKFEPEEAFDGGEIFNNNFENEDSEKSDLQSPCDVIVSSVENCSIHEDEPVIEQASSSAYSVTQEDENGAVVNVDEKEDSSPAGDICGLSQEDVLIEDEFETVNVTDCDETLSLVDYLLEQKDCPLVVVCKARNKVDTNPDISTVIFVSRKRAFILCIPVQDNTIITESIKELFHSKEIMKVFHGSGSAAVGLFRQFGINLNGSAVYDTKVAHKLLDRKQHGALSKNLEEMGFPPMNISGSSADDMTMEANTSHDALIEEARTLIRAYTELRNSEILPKREIFEEVNRLFTDDDREKIKEIRKSVKKEKQHEKTATVQTPSKKSQKKKSGKRNHLPLPIKCTIAHMREDLDMRDRDI
ncbi:hypothetical protein ScPMuIL_013584 [Solemya velum]